MNDIRHPWRSRGKLLAIINAAAGAAVSLGAVGVALGVAGTVDAWTSAVGVLVAAAVSFVDWLATVGIVKDGEAETTPVADPLGPDLLPLMPFRRLEDLHEALTEGDLNRARRLIGAERPH